MKYQIKWLPEARQDVADIVSYIVSAFGNRAAEKMLDKVDEIASLLLCTPFMGEVFLADNRFRVVHSKRNSVYYLVDESTVVIAAIIDNRRNPDTIVSMLTNRN